MRPVTTMTTQVVDQGCMVNQVTMFQPAPTRRGLTWMPASQTLDPVTGAVLVQRPGLTWATVTPAPQAVVQQVWRPNLVAQQVPVTTLCPQEVVEQIPVQVQRQVAETCTRKVPVQVCRIVNEEQVRQVPVTTYKQVVERVPKQVEVKVCKMVTEEHVRQVPVTTCKWVQEERVEPIQVRVCKIVEQQETVQQPRVVCKKVPVTYTVRVPRTVVMKVPIEQPCCGG
jgi:hypothetical protein